MNKLRFKTRLFIGFSIIIFLSIIIAFISIYFIDNIHQKSEDLYSHPYIVSNTTQKINSNIFAIHRTMKDIALSDNKEELENNIALVDSFDSITLNLYSVIKSQYLGDKSTIINSLQLFKDWSNIKNEVIKLKNEGLDKEAIYITKNKGALHVEKLLKSTELISNFANKKAEEFHLQVEKYEKISIEILLLIVFILIGLSIVLALLISKSISNPIKKFIIDTKKLYKSTGLEFEYKTENEVFHIISEELIKSVDILKSFNDELEFQVKERTKEINDKKESLKIKNNEYEALNEEYLAQNDELIVANEKALESNMLKSAFLANMSHEIRTPMNAILGFSELLKDENYSKEEKNSFIDIITSSGNRLLNLISDIVDLSKIDANQLIIRNNDFDLHQILNEVQATFNVSHINSNIKVEIKNIIDEKYIIRTDKYRLIQILSNLLENAKKFTFEGGIELGYDIINGFIQFYVKDTGVGISNENQSKIFQRFVQVENDNVNNVGTGLGLSIVKSLVELLGGKIWVKSKISEGSTFYFTIPHKEQLEITEPIFNSQENQINLKEERSILIAEDEFNNFKYLNELLKSYSYKVFHAKNGLEALDIFEANNIDLILMDLKMPKMSGFEAALKIREINKKIPIVAQTAFAMANDKQTVLDSGFTDYISKPILSSKLFEILNKYLD